MKDEPWRGNPEARLLHLERKLGNQKKRIAQLEAERNAVVVEAEKRLAGDAEPMTTEEMREAHDWLAANSPPNVLKYLTGWQVGLRNKDARIEKMEEELRDMESSFDLYDKAYQRARSEWQKTTGREMEWPDWATAMQMCQEAKDAAELKLGKCAACGKDDPINLCHRCI